MTILSIHRPTLLAGLSSYSTGDFPVRISSLVSLTACRICSSVRPKTFWNFFPFCIHTSSSISFIFVDVTLFGSSSSSSSFCSDSSPSCSSGLCFSSDKLPVLVFFFFFFFFLSVFGVSGTSSASSSSSSFFFFFFFFFFLLFFSAASESYSSVLDFFLSMLSFSCSSIFRLFFFEYRDSLSDILLELWDIDREGLKELEALRDLTLRDLTLRDLETDTEADRDLLLSFFFFFFFPSLSFFLNSLSFFFFFFGIFSSRASM
mmetsp:Transcript_21439/g.27749  ORF Transcript_21439/g.27749 Transcript_21439/m.27749 type:complete len:261 (-) Transcript_21439:2529-3311(-)